MKDPRRKRQERGALEMIEEATHLLRTAPAGALACYHIGSVPFVLGLLFFWGDMSSNPFAYQHLAGAALGMTALFLWMKCWHVIFSRRLRAYVSREPAAGWSFSRIRRVFIAQAVLQPLGLFLLPVAFVTVLTFGTVYAFFQNVTAMDDGETTRLRVLIQRAVGQLRLLRWQNHVTLLALLGFGICVLASWASVGFLLPALAKILLGVESVFSRSGGSMLNTTFLAAILGLTYLSIDPIVKAVYVLRCFYGESLKTGHDLKSDLKQFSLQPAVISVILALGLLMTLSLKAQETSQARPATPQQSSVAPKDLDRAIDDTLRQNKYTWRMPREKAIEDLKKSEQGPVARFFERTVTWARERLRAAAEAIRDFLGKFFRPRRALPSAGSGLNWMVVQQFLLYVLALAVGVAIFLLIYRVWRNKYRPPLIVKSEAIQPAPDIADENVSAEQLPEDGWTKLARELLERGELRLALRAFYLASLAHLAGRNLISLARFKSNRDYERELERRGHSFPNLLSLFGENILVFDRTWYGMHDTSRDLVQQFATNVEKIRAGG
jgi:hypothetical protein